MAMRIGDKFKRGTRVRVDGFGDGTVTDDYWRGRDRFNVRLDKNGECYDFGESSMIEITTPAVTRHDGDAP